ncbi:MAG TPA: VWA domain-containing protein [Silvibacterium sp.]|nr:VWA domain-containing protein [Silvibacterium sp.]
MVWLLALLLLCPAIVPAQVAGSDTIQVTSRIVYVDVVVRDRAGQIVRGLTEKDFRIIEDGRSQKIAYFTDHTHDVAAQSAAQPALDPLEFSNVGSIANSANIILFDFYNTAPQDQLYARKQMIRFLQALPPGRQTALFVLGTHLQMLQSFTGSTDRLVAAAKEMSIGTSTVETTGGKQQDSDMVASFAAAVGRSASGQNPVQQGFLWANGEDAQRAADITRTALDQIAAAVSGYPGRKNLYWLSDTFPLYGGPTLEINDLSNAISTNQMSTQDMADANRKEANAQIAIYPISLIGVDASGMGAEGSGMTSAMQLFTARAAMREMMNNIADATGGHAYYGTNDFAGALRKGFEDGSSYYSLAYEPQNKKWNGQFRSIAVKLAARGYSLSYRRGYYAQPDEPGNTNNGLELDAALQPDTPEITTLRLRGRIELPDKGHSAVRVDSSIDPGGVDFLTDAGGRHHAKLLVSLIALTDGTKVRPKKPLTPVQSSGVYEVNLDSAGFRKLFATGMPMHLELQLAPGSYRLRLGVSDMNNHHLGTLDMPVVIAATAHS